jgi:predicted AAA+ superfamily ATPase
MFQRLLNPSESHSFFLFGARGTGKSSLLRRLFPPKDALWLDLLDPQLTDRLTAYPNELLQHLEGNNKPWIVIDEIQKVPRLLDLVHQQIEQKKLHFALTGSSARKLKKGSANLLAGRAFVFTLFPLSHREIGSGFRLDQALQFGTLPEAWNLETDREKTRFLKSYALTYIKEEILVEQLVRSLPPFRRFLEVAAASDSEVINYSNIAKDIQSDPKTVYGYYEILEDTLLAFRLPAFHQSIRKRQKKAPKCYLIDPGIVRTLSGQADFPLSKKSFEYGKLFENFIVNEIYKLLNYAEKQFQLSYIRVDEHQEIDLVIERAGYPIFLCEIKSTAHVDPRDSRHLEALGSSFSSAIKLLISNDPTPKKLGTCHALYWKEAIQAILEGSA